MSHIHTLNTFWNFSLQTFWNTTCRMKLTNIIKLVVHRFKILNHSHVCIKWTLQFMGGVQRTCIPVHGYDFQIWILVTWNFSSHVFSWVLLKAKTWLQAGKYCYMYRSTKYWTLQSKGITRMINYFLTRFRIYTSK